MLTYGTTDDSNRSIPFADPVHSTTCIRIQDTETYAATASAHPSFLTVEDAALVNCPILLLPSKDEADLVRSIVVLFC